MLRVCSKLSQFAGLFLTISLILLVSNVVLTQDFSVQGGQNDNGQNGTTLSATKTADGFWEKNIEYDWTIVKTADPTSIEIGKGQSAEIQYTLTVTRTQISETDVYGVRGTISVTNGGAVATEGLAITDIVKYKTGAGPFVDYVSSFVDVSANPILDPGETGAYPYEITFKPKDGAEYKNTAIVTITNHSGHLDTPFGPGANDPDDPGHSSRGPSAGFSLPGSPSSTIYTDESATVSDVITCPAGFSCISSHPGSWTFNDSGTISYILTVTNDSAMCDSYYNLDNTATLVEGDTGEQREASASVNIYTLPCSTTDPLTIGYWKTHAGFTGNNADRVTPLLPIWLGTSGGAKSINVTTAAQAVSILSTMGSNGINKLYAQLLAAKLNIANGASVPAVVASTIGNADAFLATNNWTNWSSLSKTVQQKVLGWMSTLDSYNNGLL